MDTGPADFGTKSIRGLLIKQSVPASLGILSATVNILIDTIFVGRWIGPLAIAALSVVTPLIFLIASIGMAIGVGGGSVLSRALGSDDKEKALATFAHQIAITFLAASLFVIAGLFFAQEMLFAFGARGNIMAPARTFFLPVLLAVPFQALAMMGNNVIRAEDKSKHAMIAMIISAAANLVFDFLFINVLKMGITGAAYATAISLFSSFAYVFWFFAFRSELRLRLRHFIPDIKLTKEILSLSLVTFARQGVIGLLALILNHTLFDQGGEQAVTVYGIVSRLLMFMLFPVHGITQGFLPIAGYNYGAGKYGRVRTSIFTAIKYAGALAILVFIVIFAFPELIVSAFSTDAKVVAETPGALRWVFAASPIIAVQLIGAAYFQAAGKATKALLLTLSKQGFFLIPLILILPRFFGLFGVWISFPIADILSTIVTALFLRKEMRSELRERE
jgi:putative MATE family efflux protein